MSEMIIEGVTDEISSLQLTSKDFYWDGYSHFRTHEQILKDTERVQAFKKAILRNSHLFQNKVVLDVGCGTGILSMFAAQAGAKHVYAVEPADITRFTKKIFTANKFDNVITLIKGKIEEVTLPVEKVDIIICSWMGYFLFQESLIQSVLFARDKWLVEGGMIFPDKAYLYVCGVEDSSYKKQKIEWWNRVEGYNFSCVKELVMREPCTDMIETAAIVTDTYFLASIDLNTLQKGDINVEAKFTLKAQRRDVVDALVVYFDLEFSHSHHRVWFSTSPYAKWTGYKQTLFYLSHDIEVGKGDAVTGVFTIKMKENTNREVDIGLTYEFPPSKISGTQAYRLVSN